MSTPPRSTLESLRSLVPKSTEGRQRVPLAELLPLFRIGLQTVVYGLAEWLIAQAGPDGLDEHGPEMLRLRSPSDGDLVELLESLAIEAERQGWHGAAAAVTGPIIGARSSLALASNRRPGLSSILRGFVKHRNDDVEGHGLPRGLEPELVDDLSSLILERTEPLLPRIREDPETKQWHLLVGPPGTESVQMRLIKWPDGRPILIRKLTSQGAGICLVEAQAWSQDGTDAFAFEAIDILSGRLSQSSSLIERTTYDSSWRPFVAVPQGPAKDFVGREAVLDSIKQWFDDGESRACLVYGDGGMGKTTVVLKSVERLLRGDAGDWQPDLISFVTAKAVEWIGGEFRQRGPVEARIETLVRQIASQLDGQRLGKGWFKGSAADQIDRLGQLVSDYGIDRKSHLVIVDNAETLASADRDARELASLITHMARRVGRILITSRRRERIEALPIEVPPFGDEEGAKLLRLRAEDIGARPIQQAGDRSLRRVNEKLGGRPLSLEVLLHIIGSERLGIDHAVSRVGQMHARTLGAFLYEDAIERLPDECKRVLALMVGVDRHFNESLLRLCCDEADVGMTLALDALEEARGIADVHLRPGGHEVVLSEDFATYSLSADSPLNEYRRSFEENGALGRLERRVSDYMKADQQGHDRLAAAFENQHARAAKVAFRERRYKDALSCWEAAIAEEPKNAFFFDRKAMVLLKIRDLPDALRAAERACDLAHNEPEVHFTRGIVLARLGRSSQARNALARAQRLGKQSHLCALQLAYAHVNAKEMDAAERELARAFKVGEAISRGYEQKHLAECRQLADRLFRTRDLGGQAGPIPS